jgi:hypothetical protein
MHAADQIPRRVAPPEERLDGEPGLGQLGIEGGIHRAPEIGEHAGRQILRAGHGRSGRGQVSQIVLRGEGHGRLRARLADRGKRAERGHIARAKLAPISEHGRQAGLDLVGAQSEQPVPGSSLKGLLQPRALYGLERQALLARLPEREHAMRRQSERQVHAGVILRPRSRW